MLRAGVGVDRAGVSGVLVRMQSAKIDFYLETLRDVSVFVKRILERVENPRGLKSPATAIRAIREECGGLL